MEFWKMAYDMGCCTMEQLKEACMYKEFTEEEFKKICGQDYICPKEENII